MTIELNYQEWLNVINLLELGATSNSLANEYAKVKFPDRALPDHVVDAVSKDYTKYAHKIRARIEY